MQAKKDTLFSIQNEELKEERKYALLAMKITFVCFCLATVGFPLFLAWETFFNQYFMIDYLHLFLKIYAPPLVGFLGVTLLILNALRKLHFWVCYIAGGFNILCFLYYSLSSQVNFIWSILSLVLGLLLLIAPYRIQTFLQSQEKSFLPEFKTESLEYIKSRNDSSDKKRREIKKNTLFSIKDDTLREEREYSLWVMRIYFISFCLFFINFIDGVLSLPTYSYQNHMPRDNVSLIAYLLISSILFIVIARGLWKLQLWSYFLLSSLNIALPIVLFGYFSKKLTYTADIYTADIYTMLGSLFINGIFLLIPTFRMWTFLKEQKKELDAQDVQNNNSFSYSPISKVFHRKVKSLRSACNILIILSFLFVLSLGAFLEWYPTTKEVTLFSNDAPLKNREKLSQEKDPEWYNSGNWVTLPDDEQPTKKEAPTENNRGKSKVESDNTSQLLLLDSAQIEKIFISKPFLYTIIALIILVIKSIYLILQKKIKRGLADPHEEKQKSLNSTSKN